MKYWILSAILLLILGGGIFVVAFASADFDFTAIDSQVWTEKTYDINESFQNIRIKDNVGSVRLVFDSRGRVECSESEQIRYSVTVENGTLEIRVINMRRWYHYLGFNLERRNLTVYLPAEQYGKLTVETDTGEIQISEELAFQEAKLTTDTGDISFRAHVTEKIEIETDTGEIRLASASVGSLDLESDTGEVQLENLRVTKGLSLETDTGKIRLTDVTCTRFTAESDTGDMNLCRVTVAEGMNLKSDTGDITFDGSDAATVEIVTQTGDVTGTFRTEKIFQVNSKSGDVDVPKSTQGGFCRIKTSTGDVTLRIS